MGQAFIWVLVALSVHHGQVYKEHVAVYGKEDTCYEARRSVQYYSADRSYFCQKELLK